MKHKYIKTPEELYILFEGYKNSLVEREIQKATAGGVKTEKHKPPLTISGFRVYGHKNGFSIEHYFANTGNAYEDYRTICKCIEDEIRTDQIEGGMVGQYNPSITQRLNGLTEKTDVTTGGDKINEIKVTIVGNTNDKES
jgi:hypothetical protein